MSTTQNAFNPMNSPQLFGLKEYFINFVNLYKNKKLPKIILLSGDKGIGKFTLSFHLVNYILSLNTKFPYNYEKLMINIDSSFYKKILLNIQENFNYIGNNYSKKIGIEDIRSIKKKFNNTPLNSLPRFTILDDVELLNINTANALLKFIENPSTFDFFILINNKKSKIIETLKSRSLETKIFLDHKKQEEVFNNLLKVLNIKSHFSHKFKRYTTPGMLIKFSEYLRKLKIEQDTPFYDMAVILLDSYRKTKNDLCLDCIKFLLDIQFSKILKRDNIKVVQAIDTKNDILNLLNQCRNFNLSNTSVLQYFKTHPDYVR
jgi:DNA polymerase-3 subunit delta'